MVNTVAGYTVVQEPDLPQINGINSHLVNRNSVHCKTVLMVVIHVPESMEGSNCHPYQFLEICIPLCNDPIGLIQKGHLKK